MRKIKIIVLFLVILFLNGCSNEPVVTKPILPIQIESVEKTEDPTPEPTKEKSVFGPAFDIQTIPPYSGNAYVVVNNNVPYFNESDYTIHSFENYEELDEFGRCGVAYACIGTDIMPIQERGNIGMIKPTGWQTIRYENIDGKYLYNSCHLLGYNLTGENANPKNLITGTRYLNMQGMLPFETVVAEYVEETNNHVLYRVTPIFEGNNLLASGVLMEGYSVEDMGEGICFNVYCYNVQPGIVINYRDGSNYSADGKPPYGSSDTSPTLAPNQSPQTENVNYIGNQKTKKFHYPDCSGVKQMKEKNKVYLFCTREEVIESGYLACKLCNP